MLVLSILFKGADCHDHDHDSLTKKRKTPQKEERVKLSKMANDAFYFDCGCGRHCLHRIGGYQNKCGYLL